MSVGFIELSGIYHYDVITMSLPVEAPSGGDTSSEERDITLL